jgi:hypothetical protein
MQQRAVGRVEEFVLPAEIAQALDDVSVPGSGEMDASGAA